MLTENKTLVEKNIKGKSITVSREFNAPVSNLWKAFTESKNLDQWWGPEPWHAETKSQTFKPGGYWHYAMVGPENEKHWARMDYIAINPQKSIEIEDMFCDENANVKTDLPVSKGHITFTETGNGTDVEFKMTYTTEEGVKKIIEMGFEEGITICFEQLDRLLKKM